MKSASCMLILLALACASPSPPAAGLSQVRGSVRLVPREGIQITHAQASAYGDRRLRDVSLVDYSHPGFLVVYLEEGSPPTDTVELELRSTSFGTSIDPEISVMGTRGRLVVRNRTEERHVLSYPNAEFVRSIAPGEEVVLEAPEPGPQDLFLLDAPEASATVFASPGPFSRVNASGRFELTDLEPGSVHVRAWHPRFPPARKAVELRPDAIVRLDFEIGVGRSGDTPHAH